MAKIKEGDLRVLKGGRIYGPMMHDELERLLASGRITAADQVSLFEGPWQAISEYLAQRAAPAPRQPAPATATAAKLPPKPPPPAGELCVLKGRRMLNDLTRSQVTEMFARGQVGGDDLVCARGGPWMRVGDFCSVAPPRAAARARPKVEIVEAEAVEAQVVEAEAVEVAPVRPRPAPVEPVEAGQVAEAEVVEEEDLEVVQAGPTGLRLNDLLDDLKQLSDEWYVRVHGIHSAPLKKHHVKMLFLSQQITLDCPARHASWRDERWLPIQDIPELVEFLQKP